MAKTIPMDNHSDVFLVYCPGCRASHAYYTGSPNMWEAKWTFNGDTDKPSFFPMMRIQSGLTFKCVSQVIDGNIQYFPDSTHEFAGKILELQDM